MSKQHPLVKRVLTGILAMSVLIPFIPPSFSSSTVYADPAEPNGVVMLEDFEQVSLADLTFDSARIYSGNMALESDRNTSVTGQNPYGLIMTLSA